VHKKKRKRERIHDLGTRIFVLPLHKFKVNSMIIMCKNSWLIVLHLLKYSDYWKLIVYIHNYHWIYLKFMKQPNKHLCPQMVNFFFFSFFFMLFFPFLFFFLFFLYLWKAQIPYSSSLYFFQFLVIIFIISIHNYHWIYLKFLKQPNKYLCP